MDDTAEDPQEEQKDRTTEQFEKLTSSNNNLKAENEQLKKNNEEYQRLYQNPTSQTPNANQYSNLNQQQVDDVFAGMMDQSGFLDGNKLKDVLNGMNQKAIAAEQRAQKAEQTTNDLSRKINDNSEREAQNKVYTKYPQLNPDNKDQFDPKMWRYVYNELATKAKGGDLPSDKDYMDAADRVYGDFYEDTDMTKKELEEKQQKIEQKQQINAVRPVSSVQPSSFSDSEENQLLNEVRNGKKGALAEMLKRRGQ